MITAARLTSSQQTPFVNLGSYHAAVRELNALPGQAGFVWREYSPASAAHAAEPSVCRKYFTEENAARIDAVRARIRTWAAAGAITATEEALLVADLLIAVNSVANIAGTYGCFLREFAANAVRPLDLKARDLPATGSPIEIHNTDVYAVPAAREDVVYFDPPYTKRQYAAYYHLLETIARGDQPEVKGITGLRPWKPLASPFCYKTKALSALVELVACTPAERVLLSYSSDGHASLDDLLDAASTIGVATMHRLGEIGRYRPNQAAADNGQSVSEVVIEVVKATTSHRLEVAV